MVLLDLDATKTRFETSVQERGHHSRESRMERFVFDVLNGSRGTAAAVSVNLH